MTGEPALDLALRALLVWLGLAVLGVANGVFRGLVLEPRLEALRAHQASSVLLAALILGLVVVVAPWLALPGPAAAWGVGAAWVVLTVLFEFVFGRRVAKLSWSRLIQDYDLRAGRLWSLVLLAILVAPRLAIALR